jgi:uncharacterized protein YidB (DUF937 family)
MDLSSILSGLGGGAGGVDPNTLTKGVQDTFASQGGVDGLLGTLSQNGMGDEVQSWISTGENKPVDPQRLGSALGPDTVNQLSSNTGLSVQALLPLLATFLPMIIDRMTPDGNAPQTGADGGLGQIGDVLGGLLGGNR